MKIVNKIGFNDLDETVSVKGVHKPFYLCWSAMLKRVATNVGYSKNSTIDPSWLYLSNFKSWYEENYVEGYELDKDLLIEGNTHYSPETCFFVPKFINNLFKGERVNQGEYPKGVHKKREGVYCAQIRKYGKKHHLGYFKTVAEAENKYQSERREYILEALEMWRDKLPEKLYKALINRETLQCLE